MEFTNNIKKIYMVMGNACNLNCKYCKCEEVHTDVGFKINPDVYDYIEKVRNEQQNAFQLVFYGGEPLIYWKQIKEMIDELIHRNCQLHFSLISNGKLLNQEIVDYCNAHQVYVQISWDGPRAELARGYNVMKEKKHLLKQIKSLCLNGVLSAVNYPLDFFKSVDQFNLEHDYTGANAHVIFIQDGEVRDKLIDFDFDKWSNQVREMIQIYRDCKNDRHGPSVIPYVMNQWVLRAIQPRNADLSYSCCGSGTNNLNINASGQFFACHNMRKVMGTIYDNHLDIIANIARSDKSPEIYEEFKCLECKYFNPCANCITMSKESRRKYYCKLIAANFAPIYENIDELKQYIGYFKN